MLLFRWLTRSRDRGTRDQTAPAEVIALRVFGIAYLIAMVVETFATHPHPGLHARHLAILIGLVAFVVVVVAVQPQREDTPLWQRVATLMLVTIVSAVMTALQPKGIWQGGIYYVGIMAALRLERRPGVLVIAASLAILLTVSAIADNLGSALALPLAAVPWFLVMRMMRHIREQRDEIDLARVAEARAAAAAERGRIAREMHDVLAHSLSALSLQLETARLLARDRGAPPEVVRAIDRSHHLAVKGLDDARRAISGARGDDLPGPERLGALAEAFGEQSGLTVDVDVRGEPRDLAPDARLAVYRTAQEALTNIRRHAAPEQVRVSLAYEPQNTVLVVEDHAAGDVPPPAGLGLTGSGYGLAGMRERAELLGGELVAEPTSDGFRVELRLPS